MKKTRTDKMIPIATSVAPTIKILCPRFSFNRLLPYS
jgi:hypothetical protein